MRPIRALTASLLLCGLAAAGGAVLAKPAPADEEWVPGKPRAGREVQDLHYGDVLFHFYQDDFFNAIVEFNAIRQMGYAKAHAPDGELLLGGMLLSYGQHSQASDVFHRLLDSGARPEIRDRAWFHLARVSFDRGAVSQAQDSITRIQGKLPGRLEDERRMLAAQVLMGEQRFGEAAASLANWQGSKDWAGYAHFNRGVALVRAQAVEEGLKELEAAGTQGGSDEESLAVRDRANLALGFAAVQSEHPEEAKKAFSRIRLEGPWSNEALLGLGWAESALGNYKEALVPWMALQERDILDPAVQESKLAIPYAFMGLKSYGQAAAKYKEAIASFDAETKNLDASIAKVKSGAILGALFENDVPTSLGGNFRIDKLPATPETRYLVRLMATSGFQEGLKNYRDLRYIRANLVDWQRSMAAFTDMLATRRLRYAQHLPAVQDAIQRRDFESLSARRDDLALKLANLEKERDPVGLATTAELAQWSKLQNVSAAIDRMPAGPQTDALHDRARVLRGVLYWNLDHEYPLRLWQAKRSLAAVDEVLAGTGALRTSVAQAQSSEPSRLDGFDQRISGQGPRLAALLDRTNRLIARQEQQLQEVAANELEAYKTRLRGYTAEARFALAQVYDRANEKAPPK